MIVPIYPFLPLKQSGIHPSCSANSPKHDVFGCFFISTRAFELQHIGLNDTARQQFSLYDNRGSTIEIVRSRPIKDYRNLLPGIFFILNLEAKCHLFGDPLLAVFDKHAIYPQALGYHRIAPLIDLVYSQPVGCGCGQAINHQRDDYANQQ